MLQMRRQLKVCDAPVLFYLRRLPCFGDRPAEKPAQSQCERKRSLENLAFHIMK